MKNKETPYPVAEPDAVDEFAEFVKDRVTDKEIARTLRLNWRRHFSEVERAHQADLLHEDIQPQEGELFADDDALEEELAMPQEAKHQTSLGIASCRGHSGTTARKPEARSERNCSLASL